MVGNRIFSANCYENLKDFIAKVIYHEILHVYLNNTTALADHQIMGNNYVNPLADALQSTFGTNQADAVALAWSGLQASGAYIALSQSEKDNIQDIVVPHYKIIIINLIINMNKIVTKILILFLYAFPKEVYSQRQIFRLKPIDNVKGAGHEFHRLLAKDVNTASYDCISTCSVFYFRVNNKGIVDSIRFEGNLRKEVQQQIVKNIYATKGHWLISPSTRKNQKCWFMYPFFDLSDGPDDKCSESDKTTRKNLTAMIHELQQIKVFLDGQTQVVMIEPEFGLSTE